MKNSKYINCIFAIGALPFWVGRKKIIKFLAGTPGSYWNGVKPLSSFYLNHPFYSKLSDFSQSQIDRILAKLINKNFIKKSSIRGKKKINVIKLTEKGVQYYYKHLKTRKNTYYWRISHIHQLEKKRRVRAVAGLLIKNNNRAFLTQAPEFIDKETRLEKHEYSMKVSNFASEHKKLSPDEHYEIKVPYIYKDKNNNNIIIAKKSNQFTAITTDKNQEGLSHFQTRSQIRSQDSPSVIKGVVDDIEHKNNNKWKYIITMRNKDNKTVRLHLRKEQASDIDIAEGQKIVTGPVELIDDDSPETKKLKLKKNGRLQTDPDVR